MKKCVVCGEKLGLSDMHHILCSECRNQGDETIIDTYLTIREHRERQARFKQADIDLCGRFVRVASA